MIVVLMGVCGSGKTTVGRELADDMHWPFLDADDYHPQANVSKMASGVALTDADREPWLDRLVTEVRRYNLRGASAVLACSALKKAYRDRLDKGSVSPGDVRVVYLKGDAATIAPRLASRSGHYMPATLLASQFAALEEPSDAIVVDIREPTAIQVAFIEAKLELKP
jgi:gluconokinase